MRPNGEPRKLRTQQNCTGWYYRDPHGVSIFIQHESGATRHATLSMRQIIAYLKSQGMEVRVAAARRNGAQDAQTPKAV